MKKISSLLVFLWASTYAICQSVGIGTNTPDASAFLEIRASNKGLLIPRTSSGSRIAIASPAKGLLVYDTTTSSFWFHNGNGWAEISAGGDSWSTNGNAGTDSALQFLGTTDAHPFQLKVNSIPSGYIGLQGNIFWGQNAGTSIISGFSNIAVGASALNKEKLGHNLVAVGDSALLNNLTDPINIGGHSNTAIGSKALYSNTTGALNTANGFRASFSNKTGTGNTAMGTDVLFYNINGSNNTAIGSYAMQWTQTGSNNVALGAFAFYLGANKGNSNIAIGPAAMYNSFNGNSNIAIGASAMQSASYRSNLVAIGDSALYNNAKGATESTQGTGNMALGSKALFANTTGSNNIATGPNALYYNVSGHDNVAMGNYALGTNSNASNLVAIGSYALYTNGSGAVQDYDAVANTAVGFQSLFSNNTGYNNTAIGSVSMRNNTTGYNNAAVGLQALDNNITGIGNTAVGVGANVSQGDLQNATAIGYFASATASNQVRIGNDNVSSIGGFTDWSNVSDGRVKKNIRQNVPGLSFIQKLQPVTYNLDLQSAERLQQTTTGSNTSLKNGLTADEKAARAAKEQIIYTGFVAQDVEKAAQSLGFDFSGVDAAKNSHDLYALRYSAFVVPLVKAVQEQQAIIEEQNKKIDQLMKEIDLIKAKQ